MTEGSPGWRPSATALAVSLAAVSLHAAFFPPPADATLAALLNEGIVWFLALYVPLQALTALSKRASPAGGAPGARAARSPQ
jgi:hypothetical protein